MNWTARLEAAEGFLELGMPLEANEEIETISPEDKTRPEVFELRLKIFVALKKWDLAAVCAKHLAEVSPGQPAWRIAWATCVRKTEGNEAAVAILAETLDLFPHNGEVLYQLACLAALKGDLHRAKILLYLGFGYDKSLKVRALEEADLQAIWDKIMEME